MNRGLLARALRETRTLTLSFGLALLLVEAVLAVALPALEKQFASQLSQLPFFQNLIQALLGVDASGGAAPGLFAVIAWVHPVVLALVWGHAALFCTRVPAGEVDRGTIDVLLGLPVSRWQIYGNESLLWLVSSFVLISMAVAGRIVVNLMDSYGAIGLRLIILGLNLLCLYLAVGGFAWMVSAASDRRGRAIAVVFGAVLGSFLLNYLGQFWSVAGRVSFLTPLDYYKPLPILRDGIWPVRNLLVLAGTGFAFWLAGGVIFSRRDLSAN